MLNDEIKDYWEGESYVYSDIIKKSLDDEGKNAWADLVLGNAPKKEKLEILDVGPRVFPCIIRGKRTSCNRYRHYGKYDPAGCRKYIRSRG